MKRYDKARLFYAVFGRQTFRVLVLATVSMLAVLSVVLCFRCVEAAEEEAATQPSYTDVTEIKVRRDQTVPIEIHQDTLTWEYNIIAVDTNDVACKINWNSQLVDSADMIVSQADMMVAANKVGITNITTAAKFFQKLNQIVLQAAVDAIEAQNP